MADKKIAVAGIDVGTECVKALVLDEEKTVLGRSVVPTGGYFQDRVRQALNNALDEAQYQEEELAGLCATGFGKDCVPGATQLRGDTACHARGAFHHCPAAMCLVDIGGREPRVIHVNDRGHPTELFTLRRCAVGIGTFLMFASRHLDVHPTRLQELASLAEEPAAIGSYCSVFAGSDVLDRLREGQSRENIALGCIHSVAERIVEIGGFRGPLKISGGVTEYFPGVTKAMSGITGLAVVELPSPVMAGALGAALFSLSSVPVNC
ncbi:MAG: acyl-CoA dehydratase activase [bacterium]